VTAKPTSIKGTRGNCGGCVALYAENPGTDATDARNHFATDDEGSRRLGKGPEEPLRRLSDALPADSSG
jgi:hypothetical protein